MRIKTILLLIMALSFMTITGYAQDTEISGTILNETGSPLSGATVHNKSNRKNTITSPKGVFSLAGKKGDILVITYVGYEEQQVTFKGSDVQLQITLNPTRNSMNDVIVIGYGTAKRKDLVSAVDVISVKDAGATVSTNPSELLIGKAAGVQVVQANGTPGADAQIIIRGTGSFTSVDPLYVIDGIQADKNLFNALSSQDIENITVLKDASSTAIYGSAGANGVVIITTRKGRPGAPRISVNSQWGVSKAWKQLDLLNAKQYVSLLEDFAATSNTSLPAKFSTNSVLVDSNNWQKQIFRTAPVSENDINISGGSDKVAYTFSTGFISQESIIKDLDYKKLNSRFALDETLGRFRFGQSLGLRYTDTKGQGADITDAIQYAPYKPLYDASIPGGYSIESNVADFSNASNPLQYQNVNHPLNKEFVLFPQLYGEVNIGWGLKFRSQFSAEIGGSKNTSYQYPYEASNYLTYTRQATLGYADYSFYTLENYFSFNKTFGRHTLSATLGNSYLDAGNATYINATGSDIPNDNIQNISVSPTQSVTGSGDNYQRPSVISYYGRLIYSFDDRYIISGSFRRDGASNFGINNQYGNFPSVGAAWKFTEENFFKKNFSFINDGKLRVGWGRTGNNNIANFLTSPQTFSGSPNGNLVYSLGTTEGFVTGTTIISLANPSLEWETTNQTDIGLDLLMLKNRLNVDIDLYDRKSSGLLVSVPLPASTGIGETGTIPTKTENAADAENKGIEITVGYQDHITKALSFNVNANVGYNKNNVTSLGSQFTAPITQGTFDNLSTFTITQPGSPIGSFYGYQVDHVAKNQSEIDALNALAVKKTGDPTAVYQSGLLPGDFIFKDLDGDGQVTSKDQKVLGNPIPKFTYGFNAGLTYKGLDLNLVFSGVAGLKLLNSLKFITDIEATGHNATTAILNRWEQPGDVAALPRAGQDATASGNLRASDWWLENGGYLRLRNITLGYTLPHSALNSLGGNVFSRIRVYIAAQNLLTLTKYSGYDPEISTQTGGNFIFTRGIDDGQMPQPRTFLAGVQLGF